MSSLTGLTSFRPSENPPRRPAVLPPRADGTGATVPNYRAGVMRDCAAKGMTLPTADTMLKIYSENKYSSNFQYDNGFSASRLFIEKTSEAASFDVATGTLHPDGDACSYCTKFVCVAK